MAVDYSATDRVYNSTRQNANNKRADTCGVVPSDAHERGLSHLARRAAQTTRVPASACVMLA
jgi:hypothetical protein